MGAKWNLRTVVSSHFNHKNGEAEPSRGTFTLSAVLVQASDGVNKGACMMLRLATMPSVFNLNSLVFSIANPHGDFISWVRPGSAATATKRFLTRCVYSSSDSKYVTSTLSQFHPCKRGTLLWLREGARKLQRRQKPCLPVFFPSVAQLDRLWGWSFQWNQHLRSS